MFKTDGSQVSWLIYANWLEDRGINSDFVRQDLVGGFEYSDNELSACICMSHAVGDRIQVSFFDWTERAGSYAASHPGSYCYDNRVGPNSGHLESFAHKCGTPTYIGSRPGF